MWRMAIFIRHICGEQNNPLGHRWFNCMPKKIDANPAKLYFFGWLRMGYNTPVPGSHLVES